MKKRVVAILLGMSLLVSMTACGGQGNDMVNGTESVSKQMPVIDLAKYEFDYADYVTLPDYSAIPVELKEDYQVSAEEIKWNIKEYFAYKYSRYLVDETKTIVEEGDIVDVNYVGKLDGVAFEGGSAENQIIDVSGNCMADGSGITFIDGFTSGLVGAEVGTQVNCDVTFPDDYSSSELAGKAVVFTFTINSIQRELTYEDIDTSLAQTYASIDSVDEMYVMMEEALIEEYEYKKQEEIVQDIQDYLLANSIVEIPADYFADLMQAYRNMIIWNSCDGDETQLEEYVKSYYGFTLEQAEEEWRQELAVDVKLDFIFGAIADEMGMELEVESYEKELEEFRNYYNLESTQPIFESYGHGDVVYGERYMKELHIRSDVVEKLQETAIITVAEPIYEESTEIAEETQVVENIEEQ